MASNIPDLEEAKYFAVAIIVVGAAFAAYNRITQLMPALNWLGIAALVVLTRELGQRTIAEWMDAYVKVNLSMEGSSLTLIGAMAAYLTQLPIIMLFPVSTTFSGKSYEHWGKTIDAIWMKRQFWIVVGGLLTLFAGWSTAYQLGFQKVAEAFILFLFFQMMPFDHHSVPTGNLDGAHVLRWSGFYWLLGMGLIIIGLVLTL